MENSAPQDSRRRHSRLSKLWSSSTPVLPFPSLSDISSQNSSQDVSGTRRSTAVHSIFRKLFSRTSSQRNKSKLPRASTTSLAPQLSEHGIDQPTVPTAIDVEGIPTTPPITSAEGTPTTLPVLDVEGTVDMSVNETSDHRLFTREPKRTKDSELKMLHYSYVMSESASLREAVKLAHSLTETRQTGLTAQDCVHLAEMSSTYIMTAINYHQRFDATPLDLDHIMKDFIDVLREIQKTIYELPEVLEKKTVDDWKREKVATDRCKDKLVSVVSKSKRTYPALGHRGSEILGSSHDSAVNSKSIASSILETSIALLTILKEAAEIAPVPFLKGSVGTILIILQTAETTRSNREDILVVANMAEDFIASIWEACQASNEASSDLFQHAIDTLTNVLSDILAKAQAFSKRSLFSRVVGQNNDKNEIVACKQQLQNAIGEFQVITQVLQQHTLNAILAGQNKLLEKTESALLETLPHASISFEEGDYVITTRTDVLEEISDWIENPARDAQVFWLYGAAGMGKSTITRRLRVVLGEGGRLAGHFFFQRQSTEQERPDFVIGTLAYQLGHAQEGTKAAIIDAIEHSSADQLFSTRFKGLVLNPLIKGEFALPTVILLDALDEYKDAPQLLDVLVNLISQFPPNVKILVTSRREFHIESRMIKLGAWQRELRSASADAIESIIQDRLQKIEGWKQYPTAGQISQLVELADGLPIWAATACTFIAKFRPGYPDHIFRQLLVSQSVHRRSAERALDVLYRTALEHIFPIVVGGPDLQAEEFRRIFGYIYVVKDPLTVEEIEALLGDDESVRPLMAALAVLHTRASSSLARDTLITPVSERFHTSFIEFIVDAQRCTDARFRLDVIEIHDNLARVCFRTMGELFGSTHSGRESYASLSNARQYAVNNWAAHASHTIPTRMSGGLYAALSNFILHHFSSWFQIQFESTTGSPMSPEIKKAYGSHVYSDHPADLLSRPSTLSLYAQQMGHPVDIVCLNRAISVQSLALNMAGNDDPKHLTIFGSLHLSRFRQSSQVEDVESAIDHYRQALVTCPSDSPHRSPLLYNLAVALLARAEKGQTKADIDEANQHFLESLGSLDKSVAASLAQALLLSGRANACSLQYKWSKETSYLTEAISLRREALDTSQQGDCAQAEFYSGLADDLKIQNDQPSSPEDLNEVIALQQEALRLLHERYKDRGNFFSGLTKSLQTQSSDLHDSYDTIPLCRGVLSLHSTINHPQASTLRDLARSLRARFDLHQEPSDLDESILRLRDVVELFATGHPDRASSFSDLGSALRDRFRQYGQADDLDDAISLHRQALELCPPSHPDRVSSLGRLGAALLTRFEESSQAGDLENAIVSHREALELCSPGHPDRSRSLDDLGAALLDRFHQYGQVDDLEDAISLHRQTLELRPTGHPDRDSPLNNLGAALQTRFQQFGKVDDLENAIPLHRQALELRPSGHPDHARSLNDLGNALLARFQQIGQANDLDKAISLHRQALELRPAGHPDRVTSLSNLGSTLWTRFGQFAQPKDLDDAVLLHRQTLELRPSGHPDRARSLTNLGNTLWTRFLKYDHADDLDNAISLHREALDLRPPGHPDRDSPLNNLGAALGTRYRRFGQADDLDNAILLYRQTLELRPPGHPDRACSLSNLGGALNNRFKRFGQVDELNNAIALHREALELCPPGHMDRANTLSDLANVLYSRFKEFGQVDDLDTAISLHRQALDLRSPGHPNRVYSLNNLGVALQARYKQSCKANDMMEATSYFRQARGLHPSLHIPYH